MTHYSTPEQIPSLVLSAPVTFTSFPPSHPLRPYFVPYLWNMHSHVSLRTQLPKFPVVSLSCTHHNLALIGAGSSSSLIPLLSLCSISSTAALSALPPRFHCHCFPCLAWIPCLIISVSRPSFSTIWQIYHRCRCIERPGPHLLATRNLHALLYR